MCSVVLLTVNNVDETVFMIESDFLTDMSWMGLFDAVILAYGPPFSKSEAPASPVWIVFHSL